MYNPVFKSFIENSNVAGIIVDIDENPKLASEYNIRSVPTTILTDETGKEYDRVMGSVSVTELHKLVSE